MLLGFIHIENGAVITHRDSFLLASLTVVSVRRPYFAASLLLGAAFLGFSLVFADLLYQSEQVFLITGCCLSILIGAKTGQLMLLSRDLKGTELSSAVWGHHHTLQQRRALIVQAIQHMQVRSLNHQPNPSQQ